MGLVGSPQPHTGAIGLEATNHYLTGRDGGREIDLRARAAEGMHLHGRLQGVTAECISFDDDLGANLDQADAV